MNKKSVEENPQRAAAEARLAHAGRMPAVASEEVLHELRVHQIELEMQNEELRRAQLALEESRDRYVDLYEFAPVGYLTLTRGGQIAEINLTGAALLGVERQRLLQRRFDQFFTPEDRDRWHVFMANVLTGAMPPAGKPGVDLALRREDGSTLHAHLDCLRMQDGDTPPQIRVALTDIGAVESNRQLRAAQRELRGVADYTRSLIEASLDPLVTIAVDGKIMDVNAATEAITGVARERLIGSDFAAYFTEPEQARTGYRRVFEQGTVTAYPLAIRHVSGQVAEVLYNASVFRNANGEVAGIFAAARDITELKRKEIALAQSEERLRMATETARDAIVVLDAEHGAITAWNPAAEAIFGYTRAEALGQALHDLLTPPNLRETARRGISHFSYSGEGALLGKTLELQALRKDGTEFPIELSLSAMQIDGKWHATGIARDITERKRTEEALKETERAKTELLEKLNEAQRLAMLGSWEWNLQTNHVWWSDETYQIFGVTPQDFVPGFEANGKFVHPDDFARYNEVFEHSLQTGEPLDADLRLVTNVGSLKHCQAKGKIIYDESGQQIRFVGTIMDITGRKLAEESQRRLNRELRAISDCNETLVRAVDERALLDDICRIICDKAGYSMAWVGYAENDPAKSVRPVAWAGIAGDYLEQARITWADTDRGQEPSGTAIRGGKSACIQDFATDPAAAPWRDAALQRGYRSSIALPLKDESGSSFGVLNIYSAVPNAFTPEEQRLLEELSGDLAFGIVSLRARAERQRAEAALLRSEEKFRSLVHNIPDVVWTSAQDGKTTFISDNSGKVLGYAPAEIYGVPDFWFRNVHPDDAAWVNEAFSALIADGRPYDVEYRFKKKDGGWIWLRDRSTVSYEKEGVRYADGTFSDVTEIKGYQAELERKTNYDDLTGLPNRNLLADRLALAVARARREQRQLAVLVLNLDRFGEINDSLGRTVGDGVLRETAERLRQLVRGADTLARSGGDEFVLVGEIDEEDEAAHLARRILEALAQPFRLADRELFLYAGVGVSVLPKDGNDGEVLLNNAQVAMYRTKASGGNSFRFYSTEMNAHSLEHLNLENDLRRALERNEFLLHYQPQVSLRNGAIIGIEALVRWRHPQRGLVSPAEFIPLAEATGLIVPLGEWVLRTACAQNQAWQAAGLHAVAVAVNLSARQFDVQDIVALTGKILRDTGLDPSLLELELTESAAMGNAEGFVGITEELKDLSVTLSIDDFGTGYSSLSYLKRFALDRLKIDQSFVRDIVTDPESAAIAVAIITLGHSLGLSVIAEGVETEAQLTFLRARGCDEMQGYYFSKPLPAAEFEQLLRSGRGLALPASDLAGPTLLLVDDEPSILSALQRLLRREGYRILTATSAREGLELLATQPVAVVMSDQRMPEMTGSEFLAKVRKMYPDTVRIILSGYTDLKSITEVVNRGEIYKFLEKPWDDKALLETLREAFRYYETRHAGRAGAP